MTEQQYLKKLLRPLGIYDVDEGLGASELEAIGRESDRIYDCLVLAQKNTLPNTADAGTLARLAQLMELPSVPDSETLCVLLQTDGYALTLAGINRLLDGLGLQARVRESGEKYVITVYFPDGEGAPDNYELFLELREYIEAFLPCHLECEYELSFFSWEALESTYLTWQMLEDECQSWSELEVTL